MFNLGKISELESLLSQLREKHRKLESEAIELRAELRTTEQVVQDLQKEKSSLQLQLDELDQKKQIEILKVRREEQEAHYEQMDSHRNKIQHLEVENARLQKETDMYQKAFKEIGFNVSDTKDMMQSMIKAMGTKNTVQVIK